MKFKAGDLIKSKLGSGYRAIVCADIPENPSSRVSIYVFHTNRIAKTGLWDITVRKLTGCFEVINAA
jgi:hypothetical protein